MDQNISGMIAANVNLIQPWYTSAIGLVAGAILGAIIAGIITLYRDDQINKKQKKDDQIQSINKMRGLKHTMLQSKASYYSAFAAATILQTHAKIAVVRYVDYDYILPLKTSQKPDKLEEAQQYVNKKIDSELRESIELKEGLRQKERSEELQMEIAKFDERFWEEIGRIRILFPNDKVAHLVNDIKDADEDLGKFEKEIIERFKPIREEIEIKPGLINSNVERGKWTEEIITRLGKLSESEEATLREKIPIFDSKIENLLSYLENEFDKYCRDCKFFCSSYTCPLKQPSNEAMKESQ